MWLLNRILTTEAFAGNSELGVEAIHSITDPAPDKQIWLNEYPKHLQPEVGPALVTIRNAATGRRLYANPGDDLSVGFGATDPAEELNGNQLWEEHIHYKYANVLLA